MRQTAAILLLLMLFFNWYGYRIVTDILADKADTKLEARIDSNDYSEEDLIEISVPLNVPYQVNQSDFERHYGEIEIDGHLYTYVKRKIENGSLILKCIPNTGKQDIREGGADYFKTANGLDQHQPDKKAAGNGSFAKTFWSEYDDRNELPSMEAISHTVTISYSSYAAALASASLAPAGKPPRQVA